MADATTTAIPVADAPKKKRKAQGPRVAKPVFAVVTYTDPSSGQPTKLDRSGLKITLERDSAKIVELLSTDAAANAAVIKVDMPATATKAPTA